MKTYQLDYSLLTAADGKSWTWDVRHAVEGVQIFGGIGSGKTSGSGRTIALRYLKAGFGGLVLTVKPDEKKDWIEYCRLSNRSNDLVILEPGGKNTFNFLQYESETSDSNRALTENIVDVLKTVIKAGENEGTEKSDDAFWQNALDMLLFNVIDLCKLAYNKVTIDHLYNIVQTLPKAVDSKKVKNDKQQDRSKKALGFDTTYAEAHKNVNELIDKVEMHARIKKGDDFYILSEEEINAIPEVRLFEHIDQFFTDTFRNLSEKTRAIIEFTFTGFLFRLMREPIYSLFNSKNPSLTPDDSLNGKIILVNLPIKVFHKVGRDCQILFKYIWQRAMEKRSVSEDTRPVFLWADEAQNFIHEHDAVYQATARSSKIATVYITQNLPNYYAAMGGEKGEHKVKSFLGTLGTKIFHSNADIETNRYSSELLGDVYKKVESEGISTGSDSFSQSKNTEIRLERAVRPEEFVGLQTGGKKNNYKVGCIMHRQGEPFRNKKNYRQATFSQIQS